MVFERLKLEFGCRLGGSMSDGWARSLNAYSELTQKRGLKAKSNVRSAKT